MQAKINFISFFFVDVEVMKLKQKWANIINVEGTKVIGTSKVALLNNNCGYSECNIGNFYTDALLHAFLQLDPYSTHKWANASVALTTSAELRTSIPRGNVTYEQIFALGIYESDLMIFDLAGNHLLAALEYSVAAIDLENNVNETYKFLQFSGLGVTYNLQATSGNRIVSVKVRCTDCGVPAYEPLSLTKVYRIVATRYVSTGGYGFKIFANFGSSHQRLPVNELSALIRYFQVEAPIVKGLEGRIKIF